MSRKTNKALSRCFDAVAAGFALIFFAPLLVLICIAVWATDPGPVFFKQRRVGLGGEPFSCWKFRTMVIDAEKRLGDLLQNDVEARTEWENDHKLRRDPRITLIGKFLRKSSLDELPQLINVLIGDMSLVGPRPIVDAEIVRYGAFFPDYCSVRPGITGLWQISGRNDISYSRRVALDVAYAQSKTIRLDLTILFLTIPRVVLARGSY